ncbi:hypothetical protein [Paenarthrobacter sp. NPDC090522]|uniref:hypothetical protein n=1 Tax=Paenarthrobacter sp. NPDC090522 TaxID=3364383 RepID=UPI003806B258
MDKEEMWRLVESIHEKAPAGGSSAERVRWAFEMAWPDLEAKLRAIDTATDGPVETEPRDEKTLLQELLSEVRELSIAIATLSAESKNVALPDDDGLGLKNRYRNDTSLVRRIKAGMVLEHSSFGAGRVLKTDGADTRKVAIVHFPEAGQKKLLLRYAPVSILEDDDVPS